MHDTGIQAWVERAKETKLEAIIAARNIALKGRGDKLAGPCPNCGGDDRFAVHLGKQQFHCRGCGAAGGGAISFVRFLDGSDFVHAVETVTGEPPPKDSGKKPSRKSAKQVGKLVKTYDYTDEIGNMIFQVLRYEPKDFRQRRPDPDISGEWMWNLNDVRLVPYRLPALIEAIACEQTVFIVEGEKDADTGLDLGIVATTTAMGAGKWKGEQGDRYAEFFRDADVVIIPDNDTDKRKGLAHANTIASKLYPIAERVRVMVLPGGFKDLTDWYQAVGVREEFDALAEIAPEYLNGYDPAGVPAAPDEASVGKPPIQAVRNFIEGFVPPDYLVDGMLQRRFMYSMTGPTGHAKTAIALHICDLVACANRNTMVGEHRVSKGRVLYFVGENADDIRMRVIGAQAKRQEADATDDPSKDNLYFIVGVFNIGEMLAHIRAETKRIGDFDLIVVDTSAAYFLGNEELSNTQMGAHARMLRMLTELQGGPCVLVLCHPIKHAQEPSHLLPRGGGAFLAEVDGNFTVWRTPGDVVEMSHNKMRGPGFDPMSFKLEKITTTRLVDKQNRLIPTVRARPISEAEKEKVEQAALSDEDEVLRFMLAAPDASMTYIAEAAGWRSDKGGAPNKMRVKRAIDALAKYETPRLIRKDRTLWVLTEKGKEKAREIAIKASRITTRPDDDEQTMLPIS